MIWEEVGEDQFVREKVLLDLEQECLEVYRRKVDNANISELGCIKSWRNLKLNSPIFFCPLVNDHSQDGQKESQEH